MIWQLFLILSHKKKKKKVFSDLIILHGNYKKNCKLPYRLNFMFCTIKKEKQKAHCGTITFVSYNASAKVLKITKRNSRELWLVEV